MMMGVLDELVSLVLGRMAVGDHVAVVYDDDIVERVLLHGAVLGNDDLREAGVLERLGLDEGDRAGDLQRREVGAEVERALLDGGHGTGYRQGGEFPVGERIISDGCD